MTDTRTLEQKRRPLQVGAKARHTLAHIKAACRFIEGFPVSGAPVQIERLRRGGYVRVTDGLARVTDAGNALLERGHA